MTWLRTLIFKIEFRSLRSSVTQAERCRNRHYTILVNRESVVAYTRGFSLANAPEIPLGKELKQRWSVYPLFSERSNICSSHGTSQEKARAGTAVTVGKRRRWLRYQLLGMRNGEAIEFPETKGATGRDATWGFVSRSSLNCLESYAREN